MDYYILNKIKTSKTYLISYKAKYIDTRGHFKGEVAITSVEPPEEEKWAFKNTYIIALDIAKEICTSNGPI